MSDKLEVARIALEKIRDGAKYQTAFSGMAWGEVYFIASEALTILAAADRVGEE